MKNEDNITEKMSPQDSNSRTAPPNFKFPEIEPFNIDKINLDTLANKQANTYNSPRKKLEPKNQEENVSLTSNVSPSPINR